MRDRLIQQMFKQVLEPICEARFYKHSYGFRFRFNEGGIEKEYTVRIGMKSRSIFFATPATEQMIAYVRENVII